MLQDELNNLPPEDNLTETGDGSEDPADDNADLFQREAPPDEITPEGDEGAPEGSDDRLERVEKLAADLAKQLDESRKHFTEMSEQQKKIREEQGIEEDYKIDKDVRKQTKALGADTDEIVNENYYRNDFIKAGKEAKLIEDIPTKGVFYRDEKTGVDYIDIEKLLRAIGPYQNAIINMVRKENVDRARKEVSKVDEKFNPLKESYESSRFKNRMTGNFIAGAQAFCDKYKIAEFSAHQQKLITDAMDEDAGPEGAHIYNTEVFNGNTDNIVKIIHKILYDPDSNRKRSAGTKAPPSRKESNGETEKPVRGTFHSFLQKHRT